MNNIDPQDIKIKIKIPKETGTLLAQASITLFGCWTEHGWRIMTSKHLHPWFQEKIWIQSPCFKLDDSWKEMVFIDDVKLHKAVQEKIYDSYCLERIVHRQETPITNNVIGQSEKVANDIPF